MIDFLWGFFFGVWFFTLIEPLIVNFVYLHNVDLFFDIVLLKRNREKLFRYFEKVRK